MLPAERAVQEARRECERWRAELATCVREGAPSLTAQVQLEAAERRLRDAEYGVRLAEGGVP